MSELSCLQGSERYKACGDVYTGDKKDAVWTRAHPQKVGSKPKRCERVYKRTVKVRRDFLRKRRSSGVSALRFPIKKSEQAIHSLLRRGAADRT